MPKGFGYLGRLYICFQLCMHRPVNFAGHAAGFKLSVGATVRAGDMRPRAVAHPPEPSALSSHAPPSSHTVSHCRALVYVHQDVQPPLACLWCLSTLHLCLHSITRPSFMCTFPPTLTCFTPPTCRHDPHSHVPSSTWAMPHRTLDPCPFTSRPTLLHVTHTLVSATAPTTSLPMHPSCLHVSCPCPGHLSPRWASVPMHPDHALCPFPHYLRPRPFLHTSGPPIFTSCCTIPMPDESMPLSSILTHSVIWPMLL